MPQTADVVGAARFGAHLGPVDFCFWDSTPISAISDVYDTQPASIVMGVCRSAMDQKAGSSCIEVKSQGHETSVIGGLGTVHQSREVHARCRQQFEGAFESARRRACLPWSTLQLASGTMGMVRKNRVALLVEG